MLMSGLRLSLLCDAVCHKGNSLSHLARGASQVRTVSCQCTTGQDYHMNESSQKIDRLTPDGVPLHSFDAGAAIIDQLTGLDDYTG